ncbi:MAG: hypothetical protein LC122_06950 [Chitinophagales bacterium]|nr:hypothetical protein [Chitinophagales bacterium]
MTRKITLAITALLLTISSIAQDVKQETQKVETKLEEFASKTGTIVKLIDSKQPDLKLVYYGTAETRVRKIIIGADSKYFYQIENKGNIVQVLLLLNILI